jgi:fermentation-respiration switch protein FrsA (DUF1100 family)
LLGIASWLWRDGYNVLLFDYRGHGAHVGTRVTLGYREVEDARAAVQYVQSRLPGASLGILGYSMGASVAIMTAAREPGVAAVIADSPFAAQRNPINRRLRQTLHASWLGQPLLFLADLFLHRFLGYRFRDVEPLREIANLGARPILLIHGLADAIIDPRDTELLYEAVTGPKELWLLDGVEHCGAYFVDRPTYVERVDRFFKAALGSAQSAQLTGGLTRRFSPAPAMRWP